MIHPRSLDSRFRSPRMALNPGNTITIKPLNTRSSGFSCVKAVAVPIAVKSTNAQAPTTPSLLATAGVVIFMKATVRT